MAGNLHRALFYTALLLNILAALIGFCFYQEQLAATPLAQLIFVPDCPLYVFLALLVILGMVRNNAFSFIVSIGMVKYGLWTVFVLLFHSGYYFAPDMLAISAIFVLGHLGMALEGLALLPAKKIGVMALALAMGWFLINDFSDYFLGTVPSIPYEGMAIVRGITIASSILLPLAFFLLAEKIRQNALVAWLRGILFSHG